MKPHRHVKATIFDEVIDDILKTQKDSPSCYAILALLYPHLYYDTVLYDKDHLHPASMFEKLTEADIPDREKYLFYTNPENWNSILNLQLLSFSTNRSKSDEGLKEWVEKNQVDRVAQLIPTDASLEFDDFQDFITKRKELLKDTIKSIIGA